MIHHGLTFDLWRIMWVALSYLRMGNHKMNKNNTNTNGESPQFTSTTTDVSISDNVIIST